MLKTRAGSSHLVPLQNVDDGDVRAMVSFLHQIFPFDGLHVLEEI